MNMPKWKFYVERKFNYYIEWVQTVCTEKDWQERAVCFSFPLKNYVILNGKEYFDEEGRGEFEKFLDQQAEHDPKFFKTYIKKAVSLAETAEKMAEALWSLQPNLQVIDDTALLEIFEKFKNVHIMIFSLAFLRPDEYLEIRLRRELLALPKISESNLDQVVAAVAVYPKLDLEKLDYLEEPIDLLRIAKEMKEINMKGEDAEQWLEQRLRSHAERFRWMKNPFGYALEETGEDEYLVRLKEFFKIDAGFKLKKIMDERLTNELNIKLTIRTFGVEGAVLETIENLRMFIYLRTFVTEATDRLYYAARKTIFSEIARRLSISEADTAALTGDEILDFLKTGRGPDPKFIRDRKENFAVVWENSIGSIFFGSKAKQIIARYEAEVMIKPRADGNSLLGKSAYRGVVQGKARIVRSTADIEKVQRGDIMIASMTLPAYISAMEKSAAIVTDEGGITCHAAIIAREMRKPCVIGTGQATEFLRDGDWVEVDGGAGVVKLIKRTSLE